MVSPRVDKRWSEVCGALGRGNFVDDVHDCIDKAHVAFVEHEQHVLCAVATLAAGRFCGVVQTKHSGCGATANDLTAGFDAGFECGKAVCGAALGLGHRVCSQPDARDDSKRAFGAEEQLVEIGPHRCGRAAAGGDHGAIGEHYFEANDHVLDLAVAGAVLACAAACDPSAHGGNIEALRQMANREAVLRAEFCFEVGAKSAGQHLDDSRSDVDAEKAAQCG